MPGPARFPSVPTPFGHGRGGVRSRRTVPSATSGVRPRPCRGQVWRCGRGPPGRASSLEEEEWGAAARPRCPSRGRVRRGAAAAVVAVVVAVLGAEARAEAGGRSRPGPGSVAVDEVVDGGLEPLVDRVGLLLGQPLVGDRLVQAGLGAGEDRLLQAVHRLALGLGDLGQRLAVAERSRSSSSAEAEVLGRRARACRRRRCGGPARRSPPSPARRSRGGSRRSRGRGRAGPRPTRCAPSSRRPAPG